MRKNIANLLCYDCGLPLNVGKINKEHVPAKCLYKGFSQSYTEPLITIPAHESCNSKYSASDDELRNYISTILDKSKNPALLGKTFRSIWTKDKGRFVKEQLGISLKFNYQTIVNLNTKNFKGLFFHTYQQTILDSDFEIRTLTHHDPKDMYYQFVNEVVTRFINPIPL